MSSNGGLLLKGNSYKFGIAHIWGKKYWIRDLIVFPDGTVGRRRFNRWLLNHHEFIEEEIHDLISAGAKEIIIGTGRFSLAHISDTARAYAVEEGVELVVLSSIDAIEQLSDMNRPDANTGALIHLLC